MDATVKHEWRLLPLLNRLTDQQGFAWFVALHFPLYVGLFYVIEYSMPGWRLGLDAFAIVHLGLHIALRKHPKYEFNTVLSWLWIAGAAAFGALDIVLVAKG